MKPVGAFTEAVVFCCNIVLYMLICLKLLNAIIRVGRFYV